MLDILQKKLSENKWDSNLLPKGLIAKRKVIVNALTAKYFLCGVRFQCGTGEFKRKWDFVSVCAQNHAVTQVLGG